jgi:hypothetical protein
VTFGRTCRLVAGGLDLTGFDTEFDVERTVDPAPNKAEVRIFNLNDEHRKQLEGQKSIPVELYVGYEEDGSSGLIFQGSLRTAYSEHLAPDWVTTLNSGDGDRVANAARVSKSFKPGTLFNTILDDLAGSLGVGLGNARQAFKQGRYADGVTELLGGGVIQGSADKELRRLLGSAGLEYSIQNGELQVLPIGKALSGVAQLLSPQTGLVGSPKRGAKGRLKLRALLLPEVFPGRKVQVDARDVKGFFRVEKAHYKGAIAGQDWYMDLELKELAS